MSENGAFRKKKVYFTQVSNNALRDNLLSMKAKGLYAIIQSYITIEDFILYKSTLRKVCKEGEKAFESTWKELKDRGYLMQYKLKKEDGTFTYEYELLDEIHTLQNGGDGENHTPKKEGMDKARVEKAPNGIGGGYNNIDSNNTYFNNTYNNNEFVVEEFIKEINNRIPNLTNKSLKVLYNACEGNIIYLNSKLTLLNDNVRNPIGFLVDSLKNDYKIYKESLISSGHFNNFEQRTYDFDDLEKKLLGWKK